MSRYLRIKSIQEPFDIGPDLNNRDQFSVNFDLQAAANVDQMIEELAAKIIAAGAGTALNTDIFGGLNSQVPVGDGPYITIINTGGTGGAEETHNGDRYENKSVQIVVRAKGYTTARTRALAVWRALDGIRNTTLAA